MSRGGTFIVGSYVQMSNSSFICILKSRPTLCLCTIIRPPTNNHHHTLAFFQVILFLDFRFDFIIIRPFFDLSLHKKYVEIKEMTLLDERRITNKQLQIGLTDGKIEARGGNKKACSCLIEKRYLRVIYVT